MGVSEGAIRKRVKRGTLAHDKGDDGRLYVYLDLGVDSGVDEAPHAASDALISELRDRVEFLQRELERKDAILLNMTEAMKAIAPPVQEEVPPEPPEATVATTEHPGRVGGPQPEVEGSREATEQPQRRSWWREFFGFK